MKKIGLGWFLIAALTGIGCGDDDTPTTDGGTGRTDGGITTDGGTTPEDGGTPADGPATRVLSCDTAAPMASSAACAIPAPEAPAPAGCPSVGDRTVVNVNADITADTTWSCDNLYVLQDAVYVSGGTLTVEAGVVVHGGSGGDDGENALIVTTSGRIDAQGTSADPIVFTSANAPGVAAPGDWGGIVLLGEATINVNPSASPATKNVEGIDPGEGRGQYGGSDDAHDCGTLRYVRIEWAGFDFAAANELNGLTVAGCGSETELDFIQVHGGLDDGIEFFGGSANLSHAVVTQVGDDSLDSDEGYRGNVQFFIAQQGNYAGGGNRTFEWDNFGDGVNNEPRSMPTLWNATLVGGAQEDQQAMRLRAGTAANINNVALTNFGEEDCIRVDESATVTQANNGDLSVNSVLIDDGACRDRDGSPSHVRFTADKGDPDNGVPPDTMTAFTGDWCPGIAETDLMFSAEATNLTAPDFTLPAASAASNGQTPPAGGFFNADATFYGAIEPGDCWDWTEGWTAYPDLPEE